jgi:hypothetical protein
VLGDGGEVLQLLDAHGGSWWRGGGEVVARWWRDGWVQGFADRLVDGSGDRMDRSALHRVI